MAGLWQRLGGFLIAEDEAANALAGPESDDPIAGNAHYTLSQRWGLACRNGSQQACRICKALTLAQNTMGPVFGWAKVSDHCAEALAGTPLNMPTDG